MEEAIQPRTGLTIMPEDPQVQEQIILLKRHADETQLAILSLAASQLKAVEALFRYIRQIYPQLEGWELTVHQDGRIHIILPTRAAR